jgi:hypothetical protein
VVLAVQAHNRVLRELLFIMLAVVEVEVILEVVQVVLEVTEEVVRAAPVVP